MKPFPRNVSVVIVANYMPDYQHSMLNHAMLVKYLLDKKNISSVVIRPRDLVGRLCKYCPKLKKCIGYVDKFVLFPFELLLARFTFGRLRVFHIIDHSNSMYSFLLSGHPHVLTCNDLLAIKSARDEFPENPTRSSGKVLQRIIVLGLMNCRHILCISNKTSLDLSIVLNKPVSNFHVTLLPLSYPFKPLSKNDCIQLLFRQKRITYDLFESGYILHVGSHSWYKNRLWLCQVYKKYVELLAGLPCQPLVLAGKPHFDDLEKFVQANRHLDIRFIDNPSNEELNALYSIATVLFFPSIEEGFGWPILEAMSCGCPVITNSKPPMTEVGGDSAVYIDIASVDAAANTLHAVTRWNGHFRASKVVKCLQNADRFNLDVYIDQLLAAYTRASAKSSVTE